MRAPKARRSHTALSTVASRLRVAGLVCSGLHGNFFGLGLPFRLVVVVAHLVVAARICSTATDILGRTTPKRFNAEDIHKGVPHILENNGAQFSVVCFLGLEPKLFNRAARIVCFRRRFTG